VDYWAVTPLRFAGCRQANAYRSPHQAAALFCSFSFSSDHFILFCNSINSMDNVWAGVGIALIHTANKKMQYPPAQKQQILHFFY